MSTNNKSIKNKILGLKKRKNAIILAHYYQIPEIQDIADNIGDSLALAKSSLDNKADMIVFCGVYFMAETAKILSPEKKVLIPDTEAGCSLAESCPPEDFKKFKEKYPDHKVISYINCTAEIKALSDIICTSSNAVDIVNTFGKDEKLIFAPDKNLGAYINNITGRDMILWNGTCEIHDILTVEKVLKLKEEYPEAPLIAHPECKAQILAMADFIGSTSALLNYTKKSKEKIFIVATETGIKHQMKKHSPEKEFIIVPSEENCNCNDCHHMKKITMEKVLYSLEEEKFEINMNKELLKKAYEPIKKMMDLSK